MGCELMTYYPSFLRSVRILDRALEDLADGPDWTLEDLLLEEAATSRVNNAEFSQPLCTAIQVAIVQLLATWGIKPLVTVGHSSGEIGAAYAAGLISATEAIATAYYRGKVVRDINTNGGMMAVGLGAEAVAPYLVDEEGKVVVACHNSPAGVTLSGDLPALEIVKEKLDKDNVFARFVKTGGKAYHSHHMAPVAEKYENLLEAAKAAAPFDAAQPSDAIMISSVTNSIITKDTVIDAKYWSANLRSPIQPSRTDYCDGLSSSEN
jgi:acyl transferase domain-containing protein